MKSKQKSIEITYFRWWTSKIVQSQNKLSYKIKYNWIINNYKKKFCVNLSLHKQVSLKKKKKKMGEETNLL